MSAAKCRRALTHAALLFLVATAARAQPHATHSPSAGTSSPTIAGGTSGGIVAGGSGPTGGVGTSGSAGMSHIPGKSSGLSPAHHAPLSAGAAYEELPPWTIAGYLQPSFGIRSRPAAVPREDLEYGALAARAGLIMTGEPIARWRYTVHFVLDSATLSLITGIRLVDQDGDGIAEGTAASRRDVTLTLLEEISVTYVPFDFWTISAGQLRIPFTVAHRSVNTALMFPARPGPNELFLSGADRGLLTNLLFFEGRLRGALGVFNGASLGLAVDPIDQGVGRVLSAPDSRGLVYAARIDAEPLGALPATEGDYERGPFRFGVGMGGTYRSAEVFDPTGYESTKLSDLRVSGSARLAVRGFYLQAEVFRRHRTAGISQRANRATGMYAQANYYQPITTRLALGPLARVGQTVEDETFAPRTTTFVEAGLSFYPAADHERPHALRILGEYLGEFRNTERENAHAGILQVQYLF